MEHEKREMDRENVVIEARLLLFGLLKDVHPGTAFFFFFFNYTSKLFW